MKFGETLIIRRVSNAENGAFTGLASTWNRDRHGDVIARGAFATSISALKSGTRRVPLLQNHDNAQQIGVVNDADETDEGLLVRGVVVLGTPAADRAYQLMRAEGMGLSIGFLPVSVDPDEDDDEDETEDRGATYSSVDLVEVSAVSSPSNRESRVLTVKSLAESSTADLERLLRDGELPHMPRRLAKKLARSLHSVLTDEPDHDPQSLAAVLAEAERIKQFFTSRK